MFVFTLGMGHWRSWLARFHGMEEVIGSNPICSTRANELDFCLILRLTFITSYQRHYILLMSI
jgi:hypothetical protein